MKSLEDILGKDIIERIKKVNAEVSKDKKLEHVHPDLLLFMRWAYRVGKGWYGFDLGNTVPLLWVTAIDRVLGHIETLDPDFKIKQIKLKFGGLRFYIESNKPEIKTELELLINELESLLYSENLVY